MRRAKVELIDLFQPAARHIASNKSIVVSRRSTFGRSWRPQFDPGTRKFVRLG
jgi:hypothetical protein